MDSDKSIIVMGDPPPGHKKSKLYWIIGIICILLVLIGSFIYFSKNDKKESQIEIAKEETEVPDFPQQEKVTQGKADTDKEPIQTAKESVSTLLEEEIKVPPVEDKKTDIEESIKTGGDEKAVEVDKIEIASIQDIKLRKVDKDYFFDTVVTMRNENNKPLKMRNCEFELSLGLNDSPNINLGVAKYNEIYLKAGINPAESDTSVRFSVNHGQKISDLNNILASFKEIPNDSNYRVPFSVRGKFDLGIKTEQGWIYKKGLEIDFVYMPEVKGKVLSDFVAAVNLEAEKSLVSAIPKVTVFFEFDSSILTEIAKEVLNKWAGDNSNQKKGILHIEGHADDIGDEKYNQILSEKRAESIYQYLSENSNIKPIKIDVKGLGEEFPVLYGNSNTSKAKNRRVELYFTHE